MQSAIAAGAGDDEAADGSYDGAKWGNGVLPEKWITRTESSRSVSELASELAAIQHGHQAMASAANAQQATQDSIRIGWLMAQFLLRVWVRDEHERSIILHRLHP